MEDDKSSTVTRSEAIARLWNLGILQWKLDPVQRELYDCFVNSKSKTIVWSCARRLGKSWTLCCIAVEKCLKKPNSKIKFVTPTQKQTKDIISPLFQEIFEDCPDSLRPTFRTNYNVYRFKNGSEIKLAGTDAGHAQSLRGGSADICIVDEAGFCDDLDNIIESILLPTTLTTRGKVILSSTPPLTPDHPFKTYMEDAEAKGNYIKRTIYDGLRNGRLTQEMIEEILKETPAESSSFRREYMCELIRDEDSSIVPDFTEELQKEIIKEWVKPPFFDSYVAGDIGAKDFTVFLFGYYDFRAAKIIVEDEVVFKGGTFKTTTDLMAASIKTKETLLWTNPVTKEQQKPYKRVCDNDLIVINNLYQQNGLSFLATEKFDAHGALNNMREMIKNKAIIISPKCVTLINHLKYGIWASNKKSYARDANHGHYDAIDALKYLVRNVQLTKNPYPAGYGLGTGDNWWKGMAQPENTTSLPNQTVDNIKKIFKVRPSIRLGRKR